jgi:hypothetical protein
MAHFRRWLAKSGFPGRLSTCFLNRKPIACTAERTSFSGVVSFERILDIISERDRGGRLRRGSSAGILVDLLFRDRIRLR